MKTKKKNIPSISKQLEQGAKDAKAWKVGKIKFRTHIVGNDGSRTTLNETRPETKVRAERLARFKAMRADLGLSQSEMAAALRVSTKTVQGWEIGNPLPAPAFIMAELLHDIPAVRKRLLAA